MIQPIDKAARHVIMRLVAAIADDHPIVRAKGFEHHCFRCIAVAEAMVLLDAEQREYGPPIDVTDPSWLREHPAVTP